MWSRPITFLWLWPATDHEPHCQHVPINRIWRRTESTPRSRWWRWNLQRLQHSWNKGKGTGSPYSITERRVPQLIPVLGSQRAGDVSHKPGVRLLLLSARPAVTPTTIKRAATNFAAWWAGAQQVWTVCLRLLTYSVASAIWTSGPSVPESSTLTTRLPSHPLAK